MRDLFGGELRVVNIGVRSFRETFDALGAPCVDVDWRPPVEVEKECKIILAENREKIDAANQVACEMILNAKPMLAGLARASEVIPGMEANLVLHAGPPVTWENMCGPMKGAVMGALKYEGLDDPGDIRFAPCHGHSAVGPMAGIISASMPVFIVENQTYGNRAFCTINEGLGKVLRYGAFDEEVMAKLKWMDTVLYPVLKAAMADTGGIDLKNIIARALHMGDEVHNRNRAATSLFYRQIAPAIVRTCESKSDAVDVLNFIDSNDHFFLNLSMAACKASLDWAANLRDSSIVVAMSRNGREFGVQLSGTGDRWFTGPAPVPDALFFPGYNERDANPDIGDSSITETNGLGGFAIAASPAIVQFVGGTAADAVNRTLQMYEITTVENSAYQIPCLNFRGAPTGIDARKIIEKNLPPFIDTGVAHKRPGIGQIGAGVLSAPLQPFINAYTGLAHEIK
jgi:hypothetical protein